MKEMSTSQVVNLLLDKEIEITNKIHNTVSELIRLGYDTERGKSLVSNLAASVQYSLEDIRTICNQNGK